VPCWRGGHLETSFNGRRPKLEGKRLRGMMKALPCVGFNGGYELHDRQALRGMMGGNDEIKAWAFFIIYDTEIPRRWRMDGVEPRRVGQHAQARRHVERQV
jgi:hypothetical protein